MLWESAPILKFARFSPLGIGPSEGAKKVEMATTAPRTHFENSTRPHKMSACAPSSIDLPCFRADVCREGRLVPLIERNRALEVRGTRASHRGPHATKRRPRRAPDANSARRHRVSPRRWRLVEWSDPRRGNVRLHFRARLICRRYAIGASHESVGNAGSIDVTTTDKSLVTDSVKRCKS